MARWRVCLRDLNAIDGLEWIRMLYLYPTTIGDDVLDAMAESDKVCKYIDLPLQHASDAVLKRMKRPGTRAGYERLLDRIRRALPGVTLRTTFIVGFPGETEEDFAELQSFVDAMRFDHVGVFTYSHEEGTSAHGLPDDVPAPVKRRRQSRLMQAQKRHVARAQARAHRPAGPAAGGRPVGRARAGPARPAGGSGARHRFARLPDRLRPGVIAPGTFIDAEIVGSRGYDLVARPPRPLRANLGVPGERSATLGRRHSV